MQVAFGGIDRVDCGAGTDVVSADAADKVAANCEVVSRRLSVDPYVNPDSQHETAVEPDSFSWGDTVVAAFQLGRREAGAAANIGTAVSRNDGRTWTRALLPGHDGQRDAARPGDSPRPIRRSPTTRVHGVWIASTLTIERDFSHVYASRSTDGLHWSAPVDAADGADPRQGLDHVRQRHGEPVPRPLLSRVHGRRQEHHGQPVLERRRADVVDAGSGGHRTRRHAAGRAAERHARRRRGRLSRTSGR